MNPVWRTLRVTLYQGDARDTVRSMPSSSVDCVVTSPPYWGLRDYQVAGQYGLESTVTEYVAALVAVFGDLARVLTPTATVWVNVADTFGGSWGNYVATGSRAATAAARARWPHGVRRPPQAGARRKDLQGVPWQMALALLEDGWWLRDAIAWAKPNGRPESVTDRLAQRYEMVFCLTRAPSGHRVGGRCSGSGRDYCCSGGVVWSIPATRSPFGHRAAGPVALAGRCIWASCSSGGVVLDPFCGSGTTGVAALGLGCSFVGIDLDPASIAMTRHRLAPLSGGAR